MVLYKKVKYPALMLFSLCMSLDAFGSSTVVLTSLEEERGDLKSKKARVVGPSIPSIITLADIQSILECKSRVLGQVLPEARKNLASIEQSLLERTCYVFSSSLQYILFYKSKMLYGSVLYLAGSTPQSRFFDCAIL